MDFSNFALETLFVGKSSEEALTRELKQVVIHQKWNSFPELRFSYFCIFLCSQVSRCSSSYYMRRFLFYTIPGISLLLFLFCNLCCFHASLISIHLCVSFIPFRSYCFFIYLHCQFSLADQKISR